MEAVPVQKGVAVEVHELRKEFRRKDSRKRGEKRGESASRVALDGVSFTMEKGETVAILGQNGSGKSTLVRLLSTLLLPDGGSARIFGHDVVSDAARRASAREPGLGGGVLLQEDVVGGEPRLRRALLRHDISGNARPDPEILERVGFPPDRRDEPMEALSRGMQQKVALARARSRLRSSFCRRADHGPRPALEARGAGVHPRDPRDGHRDDRGRMAEELRVIERRCRCAGERLGELERPGRLVDRILRRVGEDSVVRWGHVVRLDVTERPAAESDADTEGEQGGHDGDDVAAQSRHRSSPRRSSKT